MISEADTCRKFVLPKLYAAGRTDRILEQRRLVVELDALQAEVDAQKKLQVETAAELDALRPSLLDRALKGEL